MNLNYRGKLLNLFLPLFLFATAFITFYIPETVILPDMANYLNWGLNIFNGKGYVDELWNPVLNKAPLWIFMISLSYHLFGISPDSPFVFIRLFAILNPLAVYFLCKTMYNKWVGFSGALLVLTSYSLNGASYYNYDTIWPFFALLALLFIYLAFEKKSYLCFIAAAMGMVIAYLIKDKAIALFPLPFLLILFLKQYQRKENVLGALIYFGTFFLMTFPWMFYVWNHTHRWDLAILGVKIAQFKDSALSTFYVSNPDNFNGVIKSYALHFSNPFLGIKQFISGLKNYYHGGFYSVSQNFTFAPLFLVSWTYLIIGFFRKDIRSTILVFSLFLLLPLISYLGLTDYRISQLILFFQLSYIALSVFTINFSKSIIKISQKKAKKKNLDMLVPYITTSLVIILIALQIFSKHEEDRGYRKFIKRSLIWQKLINEETAKTKSFNFKFNLPLKYRNVYGNRRFINVIEEINVTLKNRDKIMVAGKRETSGCYFYLRGRYRAYETPFEECRPSKLKLKNNRGKPVEAKGKRKSKSISKKNPVYIRANNHWTSKRYVHHILLEKKLLRFIKKNRINYILTTPENPGLDQYFLISSLFSEIDLDSEKPFSDDSKYHLFKVELANIVNKKIRNLITENVNIPLATPYFYQSMRNLKEDNLDAYNYIVDMCLCKRAGLSPKQAQALVFGQTDYINQEKNSTQ